MNDLDFNEIFDDFEKPIYNYVLRMVKDSFIAEELTQDIFLKIYRNLSTFRQESKLSTWIYRIATNTCLDHFRTVSFRDGEQTSSLESDELLEDTDSKTAVKILDIEEFYIKSEMNECIREYIDDLQEDYRTAIVLHDLQGLKNKEIAEILDCSLDNVKVRLHRARKKLNEVLASNCDFYRDEDDVFSCDRKQNGMEEA